ncbi:MAG: PHB depolymerase family esterase [bacterium]|nr:PHB depolymerase family esterase [bacterium]
MLLAFTAIDVYAFDIPKTDNLRGNVSAVGNCTFENYKYTSTNGSYNLCNISLSSSDLSNYDKFYVTTSGLTGGSYRVIININNDNNTNYIATCSTAGKQGLSLTSDFKNGTTTLTKDDLKNVTQMRIGGQANVFPVSFTLDDIHFSKSYEPGPDGTLTLLLSDFKANGVTIDANGNITAANQWGSLVLEFEDYEDITKIETVTVKKSPDNFKPGTFFDFYDANATNKKTTAWTLDDAKGKNLTTWYQFGLGVGGDTGLSGVNYQLNSVVFKYTTPTNTLSVTYNGVTNNRRYKIYVPSSAKNKTNVPVVFSLHGRSNDMNSGHPDFNTLADTYGFIVVYPQGRNASTDNGSGNWTNGFGGSTGWEATGEQNDDTEFLKKLAEKIKTDYKTASAANGNITVDPNKFYLCGFSMGGMMTYAMANAVPNIFAAYASTGGYPINEFHLNLANINRSPFLHIHPKDDGFVLYSLLEKIKQNMVARYGHTWTTSYRNSYKNCDIYDFNSNTEVGALQYIEIDADLNIGHTIAWFAPNMMYDFFNGKSYKANTSNTEWSWDMSKIDSGGWVYGSDNINFGNNSNTGDSGNHNVYTAIQLPAGKHVIYAKVSMAQGENNAYLTMKNNTSGAEIVARKLVNNSGQTGNQNMVIAYEFETGADAEYSVYVGRAQSGTSCTSLAIYKAPYTMPSGEADQSVDNAKVNIESGLVLKIDFEELKRNSSDNETGHTVEATLLASNQNGVGNAQPTSGFTYYYANRLERKNSAYHYDVIHHDAVFGNYFQNMPHADIYERTGAEDFMRIMFPANTLSTVKTNGAITIGFWVNAKLAIDRGLAYRDPSIFYLAGESYIGTNSYENPHMFNIQGLGGISGYTSETNKYAGGTTFGQFCPNTSDDDRGGFYKNNFYLDRNWHYITYQMYNGFSRYNMYVDGFPATLGGYSPTSNTSVLKDGIGGLRSIVLGGLNCRNVPFAYDVAFAYDDVVIYDRVLSHAEIKQIIAEKNYTPSWYFTRMLKNTVMFNPSKLSSSLWTNNGNGVYTYNQTNSASAALTYDGIEQIPAFRGLQFKNNYGHIKIDTNNGTLKLSNGVTISFTTLADDNTLRFETETDHLKYNDSKGYFWPGNLPDINGHKRTLFTKRSGTSGTPELTLTADATIYAIDRTEKRYIQLNFVEDGKEATGLYDDKDIVKTRSYNVYTTTTPTDSPKLRVVNNGYNGGNSDYTFKYSSSAPHIASVDINYGTVTLTGVQGSAVITAELDNSLRKYDTSHGEEALYESSDRIIATYEIINSHNGNDAYVVTSGQAHTLNETLTLNNNNDDITVTLGGWKFTDGAYQGKTDSYTNVSPITGVNCYGFTSLNTETDKYSCIFGNGSSLSTNGAHEAKSEAWNKDVSTTGLFTPVSENTVTDNVTPWTLPCRGSHIKVEPVKPGIVTVYVKQEGCVSRNGQAKPQSIKLNTVFITDETGKSVRDVLCDTKTRVADQIWKDDGRARGEYFWGDTQFAITNEICQSFEDKSFGWDQKWSFLDNWENPGMTGHVFCVDFYDGNKGVGLDGHVIISTGIVRYTFNVVPGKTYYIFSNNSAIGLAGFTFDEGKHINFVEVQGRKNAYLIANNKTPVVDVYMVTGITLNDDGTSFSGVTNSSETAVPRYDEYTHTASGSSGITTYKPGTMAKVTLSRTFKDKQWAGLCLPYSISNRQMKAAFGEDTKVVLLHHIDDSHVVFINHTNEDIIAGYPYLIFPSGTVKPGYSTTDTNGAKATISNIVTYATFEQANPLFSVKDEQNQTDLTPTTVAQGTTFDVGHHYFIGLFSQGQLGEGSYYISNNTGKLTRIGQTTNAKPYRTYIMWPESTTGAKAPMLSLMVVEDTEGNNGGTTSIDDVLFEQGIMTQAEDVYTVSGMKMGRMSDMQHLQRGIYIVNGKKFVKK